jgi:lysophospholipase L1-like esterase
MKLSSPLSWIMATLGVCACVVGVLILTAPQAVPVWSAISSILAVTGGVALGVGALFGLSVPSGTKDRWLQVTRSTAVVVCFVVTGSGVRAYLDLQEARQISTDILIDRPELGPGAATLRPNLKNARVIAPDRPHNPQDIVAGDRFDRTTRTRSFAVNTNAQGFRGAPYTTPAPGFRIAIVGDSFVFGWGVTEAQAVPQQLQSATGIEVLNLGIPAASIPMLTTMVEKQAATWDADIILFCEWPQVGVPANDRQFTTALRRMQIAAKGAKFAMVLPPVSTFDPLRADAGPQAVARIRELAGDIPVFSLSDPIRAHGGEGVELRTEGNRQTLVRVPGDSILVQGVGDPDTIAPEIIAMFEQDTTLSEPLFFDGGHTNVQGNQVAAVALQQWLHSLRWLP